ncbi:hypothetical protein MJN76_35055, partial [Salmonella enterica subsp. enterica serovar Anatum]|nr:hypothetical protein [Salmonella enterica subsp. enterica serovar Anatum]
MKTCWQVLGIEATTDTDAIRQAYRAPVKDQNAFFSVKPQPGGLIWRDWLGLSQNNQTEANYESP